MNKNYSINLIWSVEDGCYVARAPELPGCMAHGATPEEATRNVKQAIDGWLEVAHERGREIPKPTTLESAA